MPVSLSSFSCKTQTWTHKSRLCGATSQCDILTLVLQAMTGSLLPPMTGRLKTSTAHYTCENCYFSGYFFHKPQGAAALPQQPTERSHTETRFNFITSILNTRPLFWFSTEKVSRLRTNDGCLLNIHTNDKVQHSFQRKAFFTVPHSPDRAGWLVTLYICCRKWLVYWSFIRCLQLEKWAPHTKTIWWQSLKSSASKKNHWVGDLSLGFTWHT